MAFSLRDYVILEEIGQGGFGTVLKARQKSLGRVVAIKSLSTQRALEQKEILRFRREAESMAMLSHDNIISVYDYACYGNNYYIVMEFIDGLNLEDALSAPLSQNVALYIIEKVVSALRVAHNGKIIHRDIKPSNILLGRQGQVKLADFGLATFSPEVSKYSSTAAVLGTFSYMAPEAMVNPRDVDERVDIFSLGCVIYQIFTGKVPFPGSNIGEVSYKVLNETPEPITVDSSLQELADITSQCLEKDRDKRPSIEDLHTVLRKCVSEYYHEAQESLLRFVDQGSGKKESVEIIAAKEDTRTDEKKPLLTFTLSAIALAILSTMIIISQVSKNKEPEPDLLPKLSGLKTDQSISSYSKHTKAISETEDNPQPLTSTALNVSTGTLLIKGVKPGDSITINSMYYKEIPQKGKYKITLKPDNYTVVVFRNGIKEVERKVRVLPYQVLEVDLKAERTANGKPE